MHKEVTQWASAYLTSHGYTLKNTLPEEIQSTPWSNVIRFATAAGDIYLKHTPELIALEADIIQLLHEKFHASVPVIIAHNAELNCFLMKDAGRPLREILKKQFDTNLVCKAIDQFTALQLSVADQVNSLIEIGVPDWRLNKITNLFSQLLTEKNLLIEDGLSENEIREIEQRVPKVADLCQKLSAYSIKQSIVQPDFNDNNTLIDAASLKLTTIDLGEIAISHPFFSLLNWLQQMKKHHGLKEEDDAYLVIRDACLNNFSVFELRENLLDALELARQLWPIYGALAGFRLIHACGKAEILAYQRGKFVGALKEFLATTD